MQELLELFKCFFRVGGSTFGSVHGLQSLLKREVVTIKKWATEEEIFGYYALGPLSPGAIAINTAAFVGYKRRGITGAIAAAVGVILPSGLALVAAAAFFKYFGDYSFVKHAFAGIRVAVAAIILNAAIKLYDGVKKDKISFAICALAFLLSIIFSASPTLLVIAAGVSGFLLFEWLPKKKQEATR